MSDSLSAPLAPPAGASLPSALTAGVGKNTSKEQIDKISKDFEAVFLSQMLTHMFGESTKDALTGDPETDEVYQSLMIDEFGKVIARSGGIGVADYVSRTLIQQQEAMK